MPLVGTLLSLPYVIIFFIAWTAASLLRPVSFACFMCLCFHPIATLRKVLLFITSLQYLLFCNDKTWKEPAEDPASFFDGTQKGSIDKKTIIFVRHGESTWNDTFNKGDRSKVSFLVNFIPNLVWSAIYEWYLFVSGAENESWFYDSPLSLKGIGQAQGVRKFLRNTKVEYSTPREAELIRLMLANDNNDDEEEEPPSQLVSSNLRRAISTMAIGFQDRLERKLQGDSILILPQLQEISRNPDALSITPPKGTIAPSWTDRPYVEKLLPQVDTSMHTGNKPVGSNGLKRMDEFCRVAFGDIKKDSLIVSGHSLWFRSFFRTYLPRDVEHVSKKKKLINGGIVGFTLQRISTKSGDHYLIDHKSVTVLYGGF